MQQTFRLDRLPARLARARLDRHRLR